jgi:hypothetical protein
MPRSRVDRRRPTTVTHRTSDWPPGPSSRGSPKRKVTRGVARCQRWWRGSRSMRAKSGGFFEKRLTDQRLAQRMLARNQGNGKPLLGKPLRPATARFSMIRSTTTPGSNGDGLGGPAVRNHRPGRTLSTRTSAGGTATETAPFRFALAPGAGADGTAGWPERHFFVQRSCSTAYSADGRQVQSGHFRPVDDDHQMD